VHCDPEGHRDDVRQDGELFFMIGDHLGSTSIVTDANGTKVSEIRYKAWGEIRYESGASPTDYTYTGQYSYTADFGLMLYREASRSDSEVDNVRWYDPYLNHFTQTDTIVPDSYNPLDWNRYSYVRYNPLKYTDPTGHDPACGPDGIWCGYDGSGYAGGEAGSGSGGYVNVDDVVDASPTLGMIINNSANSPSNTNQIGCIYIGASDGFCSDLHIYVIRNQVKIDDFFIFLLSLDDYALSDVVQELTLEGVVSVAGKINEKFLGRIAGSINIAIGIVQDHNTGMVDKFADSAAFVIYNGKGDVLVTSQTYIHNGRETGSYVQVVRSGMSSLSYNGSYVRKILQYLQLTR